MAIKAYPYGEGTAASTGDWSNAICDDDTPINTWVRFTLKDDAGGYHPGPYYPLLGGDSPGEYRYSNDGSDLGAGPWGGTVNVGSVPTVGRDVWVQKRSWARAQVLLPQSGIVAGGATVVDIGLVRSTGKGDGDTATIGAWVGISATSTGLGSDALAALGVLGAIPLGALVDTGVGTDTATLNNALNLGALLDTGAGADFAVLATLTDLGGLTSTGKAGAFATLGKLLEPPALSSMTAGDGQFTVTVGSVSGATSYDLRYKTSAGSTWTTVTGVGTGTETVTGLTNGTAYDVQARANNADGNGAWSATTNVTPVAAAQPLTLKIGGTAEGATASGVLTTGSTTQQILEFGPDGRGPEDMTGQPYARLYKKAGTNWSHICSNVRFTNDNVGLILESRNLAVSAQSLSSGDVLCLCLGVEGGIPPDRTDSTSHPRGVGVYAYEYTLTEAVSFGAHNVPVRLYCNNHWDDNEGDFFTQTAMGGSTYGAANVTITRS